jgi:hypothetical protein
MHIIMNMMSLAQLGAGLVINLNIRLSNYVLNCSYDGQEQKFGSVSFFLTSMWAVLICGLLYCIIEWYLSARNEPNIVVECSLRIRLISVTIPGYGGYLYASAVGYSGVLRMLDAFQFIICLKLI